MKCTFKGHQYEMGNKIIPGYGSEKFQRLQFVNQQSGQECTGTTTQEVLRVLIDRPRHCANCMPHPVNEQTTYHLRMAIVLHEARALERRVEKGELLPEYVSINDRGHFRLPYNQLSDMGEITNYLLDHEMPWEKKPNHPKVTGES